MTVRSCSVMNKIYDPRIMQAEMPFQKKIDLVTKESFLTNIKLFLNQLFGMCHVYTNFAKEVRDNQDQRKEVVQLLDMVFKEIKNSKNEQSIKAVIQYFRKLHDIKIIKDNDIKFTLSVEYHKFRILLSAPKRVSIGHRFEDQTTMMEIDTINDNFKDNIFRYHTYIVKDSIKSLKEKHDNLDEGQVKKIIKDFTIDCGRRPYLSLTENKVQDGDYGNDFDKYLRNGHKNIKDPQIIKIKTLHSQAGFLCEFLGYLQDTAREVLGIDNGSAEHTDKFANLVATTDDGILQYKYECKIVTKLLNNPDAPVMKITVSSEFSINQDGNMVNAELKMGEVEYCTNEENNSDYNLIKDIIALKIEATNKELSNSQANPINNVNYV